MGFWQHWGCGVAKLHLFRHQMIKGAGFIPFIDTHVCVAVTPKASCMFLLPRLKSAAQISIKTNQELPEFTEGKQIGARCAL